MVACGHCGGCCAHCGAICGGCHGASPAGIAGAFGGGGLFGGAGGMFGGGIGYMPYVGGVPFFHHKRRDDDATGDEATEPAAKPLDCDALTDPDHPGHREAVQAIAHVDDATHESILKRIKEELEKV